MRLGSRRSLCERHPSKTERVPLRTPNRLSPAVSRFDAEIEKAVAGVRGRKRLDRLMYLASELGDFSLIWFVVGTAQALRDDRSFRRLVRLATALGVESALVNGPIKSAFRRERPTHLVERPHRLRTPRTSSFPSGHASSATLAAILLSDGEDDGLAAFYWGLAALVASSRVYVGIHHPSDIAGGAAVGGAMGAAFRRWWPIDR